MKKRIYMACGSAGLSLMLAAGSVLGAPVMARVIQQDAIPLQICETKNDSSIRSNLLTEDGQVVLLQEDFVEINIPVTVSCKSLPAEQDTVGTMTAASSDESRLSVSLDLDQVLLKDTESVIHLTMKLNQPEKAETSETGEAEKTEISEAGETENTELPEAGETEKTEIEKPMNGNNPEAEVQVLDIMLLQAAMQQEETAETEELTEPETPAESETSTEPEEPAESETPAEPGASTDPETPTEPEEPTKPETPEEVETPTEPDVPAEPETPAEPEIPAEPEDPTKTEEATEPEEPEKPEILYAEVKFSYGDQMISAKIVIDNSTDHPITGDVAFCQSQYDPSEPIRIVGGEDQCVMGEFPAMTKYACGNENYLLYQGGRIAIPSGEELLIDLSMTEAAEKKEDLSLRAGEDKVYTINYRKLPCLYQSQGPLIVDEEGKEILSDRIWGEAKAVMRIEHLTAQADGFGWEATDHMMTVTDTNKLVLFPGEATAGTYRAVIQWKENEITIYETEIPFYVQYRNFDQGGTGK